MAWVSLDIVDRSMMLALVETKLEIDFNLLTLVGLQNVALLGTNEVLKRRSIGVIFETGTSEHLRHSLTIDLEILNELQLFSGTWLKVSLIPPEQATVRGRGDALNTGFSSDPVDVVDGVVVRLLQHRSECGSNRATRVLAVPPIKEANAAVVGATDDQVRVFLVKGQRAEWRGGLHADFRRVRVVQVPNVGALGHRSRHLLEAQLRVGRANTKLAGLRVPRNLRHRALDSVRVLEDHHSLGRDRLGHELGVLALEILLEQVDFVVLLDAARRSLYELASRLPEAQLGLFDKLTHVLVDLVRLLVVVLFGPATDSVRHTVIFCGDALRVHLIKSNKSVQLVSEHKDKLWVLRSEGANIGHHGGAGLFKSIKKVGEVMEGSKVVTYTMLRQLRNVVEGDLVRVTRSVFSVLIAVEGHGTDDSGLRVLEGRVTSEVRPLLLICVFFSHPASKFFYFLFKSALNAN